MVGGGEHDVLPLTVTTYDSAYLHMEHFGSRFGLIIFDECHHLPGETYALAARFCLAPFRLGLSATPERPDGREALLTELVGPIVYRRGIVELSGTWLADYETVRLTVELSPEERAEYDAERASLPGFPAKKRDPHRRSAGLQRLRHPRFAERGGPARVRRVPAAARDRLRRSGQDGLSRAPAHGAPRRSRADLHAGQRDGVRNFDGAFCSP